MQARNTMPPRNIVIIGLGGIGSWLVEPLLRYCANAFPNNSINYYLVDGDSYSSSNQVRQSIHPKLTGMNKASASALRMRQYFPTLKINEIPEYLSTENIEKILGLLSGTYIFNCCDNNYCRKIVCDYLIRFKPSHILFSGGNELYDGNSHVYDTINSCQSLIASHPEVDLASNTEDRGAMSCQQISEIPSSSQIIVTNFWVAAVMLQQFYLKMNSIAIQETFIDIKRSAINAIDPIRT